MARFTRKPNSSMIRQRSGHRHRHIGRKANRMSFSQLTPTTQHAFGDKTRGKILRQSLALFNEFGYDRVTTAKISKVTGVLEGTLWYHFNTKQALVLNHLDTLEACLEHQLQKPISESIPHILGDLEAVFTLLWDFRYLLSGTIQQLVSEGSDAHRLQTIYLTVERMAKNRLKQADGFGLIDLSTADTSKLATTMIMIGRYWIDYVTVRDIAHTSAEAIRHEGMAQLISVLQPYFTAKTQAFQASTR